MNDWVQKAAQHLPRKEDVAVALLKMLRQPTTHLEKKRGSIPSKKTGVLCPVVFEHPTILDGIELAIRGDSSRWPTGSKATREGSEKADKMNGRTTQKNCLARGHWTVWVLGWELSLWRVRRRYADQDLHIDSGIGHDSQKMLAGAWQQFFGCRDSWLFISDRKF